VIVGPAFYWILWLIRVTVGPWFENLPHAGGIGQAMLQSAADTIWLAVVWRRTNSVWIALATIVLLATAAYDLCLSALEWNPMMGSALAKIATALVVLKWPEGSARGVALAVGLAWCAVQSYTGAYVGDFLDYYYLSLMPAAVLTLMLTVTALRPAWIAHTVAIAVLLGTLTIVPTRLRVAATLHRMPEYGALVDGSRQLVQQGRPMQAIQTEFTLPPTSDSQFIYEILGGRIVPSSPWIGVIKSDGRVVYRRVGTL
jgi:hypothetical protein